MKVAIACQGGGSHAGFTAGALQAILMSPGLDTDFEIVALSGTSGGAMCALLAWYGLLQQPPGSGDRGKKAAGLLQAFWDDLAAHGAWDVMCNAEGVLYKRLVDAGALPNWPPLAPLRTSAHDELKRLITKHVMFDNLPSLLAAASRLSRPRPSLHIGAADVCTGEFLVFEDCCPDPLWRREALGDVPPVVDVRTVLASAAVPPLMPAVRIPRSEGGDLVCWDGLFGLNPPITCLLNNQPQRRPAEIWVLQIDPESRDEEPVRPGDVVDRRFELSSNLSLNAEIHWVQRVNQWIEEGQLRRPRRDGTTYTKVDVARLAMSASVAAGLDLASKSDRDHRQLALVMEDGQTRARAFLLDRPTHAGPWWESSHPPGRSSSPVTSTGRTRTGG